MEYEGNLWISKRKSIIFLIAVIMLVVIGASFINMLKEDEEPTTVEYKPYDSMYNASRYFFRVYYPDDWDVESGTYGFMLNKEEDLVLEVFPLVKSLSTATPKPADSTAESIIIDPDATKDPRAGMERDSLFSMNIYYKEYGEIIEELEKYGAVEKDGITGNSSNNPNSDKDDQSDNAGVIIQDAVSTETASRASVNNEALANYIFDKFMEENSEKQYTFLAPKIYRGDTIEYCVLPFEYVESDIRMTGELYVASRGMAYYEILVLGTNAAFSKYNSVKDNIIYNIKFSVFDY